MTIKVLFECDGCDASAPGTHWLSRRFEGINGHQYELGVYKYDKPEDVKPDGWVAYDPYTGCCYCPDCWTGIESDVEAANEAGDAHIEAGK